MVMVEGDITAAMVVVEMDIASSRGGRSYNSSLARGENNITAAMVVGEGDIMNASPAVRKDTTTVLFR